MNTLPDVRGARPGVDPRAGTTAARHPDLETAFAPGARARAYRWWAQLDTRWGYPLAVFALTRVLLLAVAVFDMLVRHDAAGQHWSLGQEFRNWDGGWYLGLARAGYPHVVSHMQQTTLGFFPLFSLLVWLLAHALPLGYLGAGLVVSLLTGAVATVVVGRLAAEWWGEQAVRRAVLFFCLFPGSIVFSMVYTEGLLITLVGGCLLALNRRRWIVAGLLAGAATAVEPVGVAIIPACAVAAALELNRRGWAGRRALAAPLLAPLGIVSFGVFLWRWTGTPLATYISQRDNWHETSTPLAIPRVVESLVQEIAGTAKYHPNVNLNLIAALMGTAFLLWGGRHLWQSRTGRSRPAPDGPEPAGRGVPAAAFVWTAVIAAMTVTANSTPPNARMLITAFPVILAVGARLRGRAYGWLIGTSSVLLVVMSALTLVSTSLRP